MNNQNSIKNKIRRYFLGIGDTNKENISEVNIPINKISYTPKKYKTKEIDITRNIGNPALARATRSLQISNPFKGV